MLHADDDSTEDEQFPHHVTAIWIDRQAGSGSLDKTDGWAKNVGSEYEHANDGRSDTRTTFYWNGDDQTPSHMKRRDRLQKHRDPDDRRSWGQLSKMNDGVGDPSRKQDNFEADVRRWVKTFCSQLDLPSYYQDRTEYVVERDIDLSTFGSIPSEHVILGAITLVVDSEVDVDPDEWSPDDWIIYRDDFVELMEAVEMDRSTLWTVRKQVHAQADSFVDAD